MPTLTVYGGTEDNYIYSSNADLATMRAGSGLTAGTATTTTGGLYAGQWYSGGKYYGYETFFGFDTSSIPDADEITDATLSLYLDADQSGTDFDCNVRLYDYGAAINTSDWMSAANGTVQACTKLASINTNGIGAVGMKTFTSETAFKSNINKTGSTRMVMVGSRFESGDHSGGASEYVTFTAANYTGTSRDPKLVVNYIQDLFQKGNQQGANTQNITVPRPGNIAVGDILIYAMAGYGFRDSWADGVGGGLSWGSTPSGWTLLHSHSDAPYGTNSESGAKDYVGGYAIYYKVVESGDLAVNKTWTFSYTGGGDNSLVDWAIYKFAGPWDSTPIDSEAYGSVSTNADPGVAVTTTVANCLVVGIACCGYYNAIPAPPSGMSEVVETMYGNVEMATMTQGAAGSTGTKTWDHTTIPGATPNGVDADVPLWANMVALQPVQATGPTAMSSFAGVAKASISSINGVALANIDSVDAVT